jgi:hypothetical protein
MARTCAGETMTERKRKLASRTQHQRVTERRVDSSVDLVVLSIAAAISSRELGGGDTELPHDASWEPDEWVLHHDPDDLSLEELTDTDEVDRGKGRHHRRVEIEFYEHDNSIAWLITHTATHLNAEAEPFEWRVMRWRLLDSVGVQLADRHGSALAASTRSELALALNPLTIADGCRLAAIRSLDGLIDVSPPIVHKEQLASYSAAPGSVVWCDDFHGKTALYGAYLQRGSDQWVPQGRSFDGPLVGRLCTRTAVRLPAGTFALGLLFPPLAATDVWPLWFDLLRHADVARNTRSAADDVCRHLGPSARRCARELRLIHQHRLTIEELLSERGMYRDGSDLQRDATLRVGGDRGTFGQNPGKWFHLLALLGQEAFKP